MPFSSAINYRIGIIYCCESYKKWSNIIHLFVMVNAGMLHTNPEGSRFKFRWCELYKQCHSRSNCKGLHMGVHFIFPLYSDILQRASTKWVSIKCLCQLQQFAAMSCPAPTSGIRFSYILRVTEFGQIFGFIFQLYSFL